MSDGSNPVCDQGSWIFDLPADDNPATRRRSEALWVTNGVTNVYSSGDLVRYDAYLSGDLGPAGQSNDSWHVLWQLHGKTNRGWVPPPLTLAVVGGNLVLNGDASRSDGGGGHWWRRTLAPYADGTVYRIQVEAKLSSDPGTAYVSAKVNGRSILDRWHIIDAGGEPTGTIYADQPSVNSRSGLYRGSYSRPPTYRQWMALRVLSAG